VCDDGEAKPTKPREPKEKRPKSRKDTGNEAAPDGPALDHVDRTKKLKQAPEIDFAPDYAHTEPEALQVELRTAEKQFLSLEGDLDAPERRKLWPQLAKLNAALGAPGDAGLCFLSAMWFHDKIPANWAQSWLQIEASTVQARAESKLPANRTWVTEAASGPPPKLDALLTLPDPTVADLRALAAYLVWAGVQSTPPQALLDRLNPVQRFLEQHERLLPVRAVWLTWLALVRLSHHDVLALARTRDRLLERLYQGGLRPETDLPSFLRFSGRPTNQRYQGMRQWMTQLCELVHMWAEENSRAGEKSNAELAAPMKGYIDLLFAFGLARLGEPDACRHLLQRAAGNLGDHGPVHALLLMAFDFRVRQALDGKPHAGPLPEVYFRELNKLDQGAGKPDGLDRYAAERMQCEMRILDPDRVIDPYRHIRDKKEGLEHALAELADLGDRSEIATRIESLWQQAPKGAKGNPMRTRVLSDALNLGPHVSEEFSRKMLERTVALLDALPPPPGDAEVADEARLLERALFVAAHFDRTEQVQPLVGRFKKLLRIQVGTLALQAVIKTAHKCFRGLRKLGLRKETEELLTWAGDVITGGQAPMMLDANKLAGTPEKLQVLLELAGGWCYLNRNPQAEPVLNAARTVLFRGLLPSKDQTALARAYIGAVGQGPVEAAQARLEDLFTHLRGVRDTLTTKDYYSRHQLEVIESVILAVTHDDFTLGVTARRWLEDDEFLVRKRIHDDVRTMLGKE
jgi:cellulose synthase operon protein C